MQRARRPRSLALASAGSSSEARIAMMAMTTRSSIRVKPAGREVRRLFPADAEQPESMDRCFFWLPGFIGLQVSSTGLAQIISVVVGEIEHEKEAVVGDVGLYAEHLPEIGRAVLLVHLHAAVAFGVLVAEAVGI